MRSPQDKDSPTLSASRQDTLRREILDRISEYMTGEGAAPQLANWAKSKLSRTGLSSSEILIDAALRTLKFIDQPKKQLSAAKLSELHRVEAALRGQSDYVISVRWDEPRTIEWPPKEGKSSPH